MATSTISGIRGMANSSRLANDAISSITASEGQPGNEAGEGVASISLSLLSPDPDGASISSAEIRISHNGNLQAECYKNIRTAVIYANATRCKHFKYLINYRIMLEKFCISRLTG